MPDRATSSDRGKSRANRRRNQAAARMRKMRRLRRADLMRVEFHISRRKLRKIAAARENLADVDVAQMPDQFLLDSLMRSITFGARLWLRRHAARRLRVTEKASSAAG